MASAWYPHGNIAIIIDVRWYFDMENFQITLQLVTILASTHFHALSLSLA